jgi:alkyl sulfatase BDS1-like metallo-beta-lactamase superfamily hydrolase
MRKIKWVVPLLCILLMAGCATQGKSNIDQAIQARAAFNITLGSFNTNLATLPPASQAKYATKAVPIVKSGALALDTMDAMVAGGVSPTPESLQQYMAAKNALIDMIAQIVLEQKGVK